MNNAIRAVEKEIARWVVEGKVIEYVLNAPSATVAFAQSLHVKPAWGADLRAEQIPASATDSNIAQTFLTYPQRNLDSYSGRYSFLRQRNAGLG